MAGVDGLFAEALRLEDLGRPEEALGKYASLLHASPDHADAWHNRGLLLARRGRLVEAEKSHRDYVRLHPDSARAHGDLADVLLALGKYDDALDSLDRVLERNSSDVSAIVRRGMALACLRRFAEARHDFNLARTRYPQEVAGLVGRLAPGSTLDVVLSPENIFLARRYAAQGQCNWAGWREYVEEMKKAACGTDVALEPAIAFMSFHMPLTAAERHAIARSIALRIEARTGTLPPPPPRQRRHIRIGVLSPDFREHLNAYLLLPLFELADRERFQVYAYSLAADDGSAARGRIRAAADCFRDLQPLSDHEAALAIRNDDIDILLDAAGHTTGSRFAITAQRPARIQASYLAFPGSLGSRRLDYAIVDPIVAPSQGDWSESLIYLPSTFFLYDFRTPTERTDVSRKEYGLPDGAFVFCAFHKAEKITPESFDLWMEILLSAPRSVLWFAGLPSGTCSNLRTQAAARGVDPSRLFIAPYEPHRPRYLARQSLGDLMLDAVNHNAMTTACDALRTGLPVLTLSGSAMSNRAGESLLRAAGLPELVAPDRRAYVQTAVRLALDRNALGELKRKLTASLQTAPLFDTAGRVRELEQAFAQMPL